jgi:very-short-patch-repair endonuclease
MRNQGDRPDAEVAKIAARQHGAITVGQLRAVGIEKSGIARRVRAGRLHSVHRGVYAVGHPGLDEEGRWMAAVLACGAGAALSHRSAAELWELLSPRPGAVDVSIASFSGRRNRTGIRLHRCASLSVNRGPSPVTTRRRIPVTTPARTLLDLSGAVSSWEWRKAVRQAEFKKLPLGPELETDRTRSDLERDFLRLCRRHGLPAPEVNVKVGGWTVDFLWRAQRVAAETDFYGYHRGRIAFQDDHARDLGLRRFGLRVRRYDEQQVNERPEEVVADLRRALARG